MMGCGVAQLHQERGQAGRRKSDEILKKALDAVTNCGEAEQWKVDKSTFRIYRERACLQMKTGTKESCEDAIKICTKVDAFYKKLKEERRAEVDVNDIAVNVDLMGSARRKLVPYAEDADSRQRVCKQALADYESALGWSRQGSLDVFQATVLGNMAYVALLQLKDQTCDAAHRLKVRRGAKEKYEKAIQIREATNKSYVPSVALLHNSYGELLMEPGTQDFSLAWEQFKKAKEIRDSTNTLKTLAGSDVLKNMASLSIERGYYPRALEWYEQAIRIRAADLGCSADLDQAKFNLEIGKMTKLVEIQQAVLAGNTASGERLLQDGMHVDSRSGDDVTLLMIAANEGHLAVAEVLLGRRANVLAKGRRTNESDKTALAIAAYKGHREMLGNLLSHQTTAQSKRAIQLRELGGELAGVSPAGAELFRIADFSRTVFELRLQIAQALQCPPAMLKFYRDG